MRKFIKIFLSIVGFVLLAITLFIGGMWLKYRSFVDTNPKEIPESIAANYPLSAQVNPFIGTGGVPWTCAYNFPGPSLPFGMMRLSPETASMITNEKGLNTSGYFYGDNKIIGFSHTRLVGTGATDGGHFLVFPTNGERRRDKTEDDFFHYSHENELAYPGYYSLDLPDQGIKVELTSTERVGIHQYTFAGEKKPEIILDVTHAIGDKRSEDGYIKIYPNTNKIEGHVRTFGSFAGRYGGIKVYFAARFSSPFSSFGVWKNDDYLPNSLTAEGDKMRAHFTFDESRTQSKIELQLAISHVSIDNAWENLALETKDQHFEEIAEEAIQSWENRLSSINITDGTKEQQINFYTALYRSFQMPTIFNDVNGQYIGFDKQIHKTDSINYFTDMSIWDTFRTTHPLYNLIAPYDQLDPFLFVVVFVKK